MPAIPLLCVMGDGERNSSCPKLQRPGLTVRQIGDGHHFGGLDGPIAEAIRTAAEPPETP